MTIEVRRVEIGGLKGRENQATGLILIERLPFIARVEKMPNSLNGKETDWRFFHSPYHPLKFQAPYPNTVGRTQEDRLYMLEALGVCEARMCQVDLLAAALQEKQDAYAHFYDVDYKNPVLRQAYRDALAPYLN